MTNPNVKAIPTCPIALAMSLIMMAPVPANTRIKVPINSAISFFCILFILLKLTKKINRHNELVFQLYDKLSLNLESKNLKGNIIQKFKLINS